MSPCSLGTKVTGLPGWEVASSGRDLQGSNCVRLKADLTHVGGRPGSAWIVEGQSTAMWSRGGKPDSDLEVASFLPAPGTLQGAHGRDSALQLGVWAAVHRAEDQGLVKGHRGQQELVTTFLLSPAPLSGTSLPG